MVESPEDPAHPERPGTPRWVIALGIAAVTVVLLVVAVMLIAGGEHGPGRHAASSAAGQETPAPNSSEIPDEVGGPAGAGMTARTVAINTLDTLTFEPGAMDVSAGEVITFVVTDPGQVVHELTLGDAHEPGQYEAGMRGRIAVT